MAGAFRDNGEHDKEEDREVGAGKIAEDSPTRLTYLEEVPLVSFEPRNDIDCFTFWRIMETFVKRF